MHIIFLSSDPRWPTGGHFGYKKPDIEHVLNRFSDTHLPVLFKLGTQIKNDGLSFIFEIRSEMTDWRPFSDLNVSPTIFQTCMV